MRKVALFLKQKTQLLAAVIVAAVVGGATTGAVMAAIPDSNGDVVTCYQNSGGAVRVVDTANDACGQNETELNLTKNALTANSGLFKIENGAVNTTVQRNITSYSYHDGTDNPNGITGYCFGFDFTPDVFSAYSVLSSPASAFTRGDGTEMTEIVCPTGQDYFVYSSSEFLPLTVWFSK